MEKLQKLTDMDRLLVIGPHAYGTTSWSRLKELKKMFSHVGELNLSPYIDRLTLWNRFLTHHAYMGSNIKKINEEINKICDRFSPQIVWIDKGLHVWPTTLKRIKEKGCGLLIHFSPDNQIIKSNQSASYLNSIPVYDLHVTTKTHNVGWLTDKGARSVCYVGNGFDPDMHRPVELTAEELKIFGCGIGFVGHWEPSREELLLSLYEKGYKLKVWGGSWKRAKHKSHPLFMNARHLTGEEYAKAICGAKINLCLLSVRHKDKTTDRSVEIPACCKFMLAERTDEHAELFKEGVEAEFYDSFSEMIRKIDHYLAHEQAREDIALHGHERCVNEYSNEIRLKELFEKIMRIDEDSRCCAGQV